MILGGTNAARGADLERIKGLAHQPKTIPLPFMCVALIVAFIALVVTLRIDEIRDAAAHTLAP